MNTKLKILAAILVPPAVGITALLIFPATRLGGVGLLIAALLMIGICSVAWGMSQLDEL